MNITGKLLLLAPALLLAACAQSSEMGPTAPAAQASLPPAGDPITLTLGGYYSAAAGFTVRGHR